MFYEIEEALAGQDTNHLDPGVRASQGGPFLAFWGSGGGEREVVGNPP